MNKRKSTRRQSELPTAKLDAMAAEFDREFVADTFGSISRSERARFERARKRPGRPRIGAGAQAISVTVEKNLLRAIDRIAKQRKTTRARLIAKGLEAIVRNERKAAS